MKKTARDIEELKESLEKIKALLAWRNLKAAENSPARGFLPLLYDPTDFELRAEIGVFLILTRRLIKRSTEMSY